MAVTVLRRALHAALALATALAAVPSLDAQGRVTTPKDQFGWSIGDDYRLVTYTQLTDYWTFSASAQITSRGRDWQCDPQPSL